ncbi:MAG: kelch repeat-containing protein [Bacteroidales bacterium]
MKRINRLGRQFLHLGLLPGVLTLGLFALPSCDDEEEDLIGNWVEEGDFEGVTRSDAVAFSVGDKAYITTGYDGDERLADLWEYDADKDAWTQKADFPGVARNAAVAFGAGSKGYVGTGYDGDNKLADFWAYDPATNSWDSLGDFPGTPRWGAVAFSIDGIGYVGTGFDGNYLKDFYAYDPASGWSKKTSAGGSKRRDAVAFAIDGIGYVATGMNNGVYEDDFWAYDPGSDSWTELRDISNATDDDFDDDYSTITGDSGLGFSMAGKGYVVTESGNVWEYEPASDLWVERTNLEGATRTEAISFVVNDVGYIGTGRTGVPILRTSGLSIRRKKKMNTTETSKPDRDSGWLPFLRRSLPCFSSFPVPSPAPGTESGQLNPGKGGAMNSPSVGVGWSTSPRFQPSRGTSLFSPVPMP